MKNVFKFAALALAATSMLFVACSKDEDEDNNTTTKGELTDDTPSVTFTFDGTKTEAQDAGAFYFDYNADTNFMMLDASKDAENYPEIELYMLQEKGTANFELYNAYVYSTSYNDRIVTDGTSYYGDWMASSVSKFNVTNLNLTAMMMNIDAELSMFDYYNYAYAEEGSQEEQDALAIEKALKVEAKNIVFVKMAE